MSSKPADLRLATGQSSINNIARTNLANQPEPNMNRCISICALAMIAVLSPIAVGVEPQVAHMVYFKLKEDTGDAKEKLVVACKKYLSGHEGTVYFSVGVLAKDLDREVNDLDFDVLLNLVFRNKEAHDTYQTHPRHLKFIEENKDTWAGVRVFDSYLAASVKDQTLAKRIPLPDLAASFAGMIRGVVVEEREGQVVLKVARVPKEWKHSRAQDAEALIGKNVLVAPGKHDLIRRFVATAKGRRRVVAGRGPQGWGSANDSRIDGRSTGAGTRVDRHGGASLRLVSQASQ